MADKKPIIGLLTMEKNMQISHTYQLSRPNRRNPSSVVLSHGFNLKN